MTDTQLGFDVEARAQILERVLTNASDEWKRSALTAIGVLAASGRDFQATDLLALGVEEPDHPNRWGGVMAMAARAGLIEHSGVAPSNRTTTQASLTRTWRGADIQPAAGDPDRIRALSVNRPYAQQIMRGVKVTENRSRPTHYRGPLIVHASQRTNQHAADDYDKAHGVGPAGFLGVVELVGVCDLSTPYPKPLGCDCGPGALPGFYHWKLARPVFFGRAVPGKGRLGLFIPPLAVADMARRIHTHPEGLAS